MGSLGKGHLMIRLLELKKANNGINLVREVMKNLMRTRLLPLPLMRKSMRNITSHISIE
jgi:hypothetical protein